MEPHELRNAKYDGWFITFAEAEARKAEWSKLSVSTTAKARRMLDVQFILELMIQTLTSGAIIGFDQDVIEQYCADFENPLEFEANFS